MKMHPRPIARIRGKVRRRLELKALARELRIPFAIGKRPWKN